MPEIPPSAILGPDGQPLRPKRAELGREIAAPTTTGVRQVVTGHPAEGLDPQGLAMLLREADGGDPIRFLELAEQIEEKEPQYLTTLGTRKRQVAQLRITVEPGGTDRRAERDADLVRAVLERDTLESELHDILDAIGKGYSATEIVWDLDSREWTPRRLAWRDPRWFGFDPTDLRTLRLRDEAGRLQPLPFGKFIVHRVSAKSGIPLRGGLARPVSWWWLFKNFTVKDWVTFAEIYGQPLRVGKYHQGATDQEIRTLMRALSRIGTDAAAAIPESMQIEFVKDTSASSSADIYERLCRYVDELISKLVLGQTTTTDAISGGHAVSQEHNEVRGDIQASDAGELSATLTRDVARPIVLFNHGEPPGGAFPRVRVSQPDTLDSDQVEKLVRIGARVSMADVRQRAGLREPDDESDVLPGRPPAGARETDASGGSGGGFASGSGGETKTAAQAAGGEGSLSYEDSDSLDGLLETMLAGDGWEADMEPVIRPILDAADQADSLEAFRDQLPALLERMDAGPMTRRLAQARYQARLAGEVEAPLSATEARELTRRDAGGDASDGEGASGGDGG